MSEDITKLISTASKTKLITLAISDTLGNQTLNPAERRAIQKRAEKDGWAEELERAVFKAPHTNEIGIQASAYINRAGYNMSLLLHETDLVGIAGALILELKIEKAEDIKNLLETILPRLADGGKWATVFNRETDNKNDVLDMSVFEVLRWAINHLYLVNNAKVGSYRLYPLNLLDNLAYEFYLFLVLTISALSNRYEVIRITLNRLSEKNPEAYKIITEMTGYTPEYAQKQRTDLDSLLPEKMDDLLTTGLEKKGSGKDRLDEYQQLMRDILLDNEYLLKFIKEDIRKELDQAIEKAKSFVLYGR